VTTTYNMLELGVGCGTQEASIDNAQECEDAALEFESEYTYSGSTVNSEKPPGCFAVPGNSVIWFNDITWIDDSGFDSQKLICK
jgi:hypothetical protein